MSIWMTMIWTTMADCLFVFFLFSPLFLLFFSSFSLLFLLFFSSFSFHFSTYRMASGISFSILNNATWAVTFGICHAIVIDTKLTSVKAVWCLFSSIQGVDLLCSSFVIKNNASTSNSCWLGLNNIQCKLDGCCCINCVSTILEYLKANFISIIYLFICLFFIR